MLGAQMAQHSDEPVESGALCRAGGLCAATSPKVQHGLRIMQSAAVAVLTMPSSTVGADRALVALGTQQGEQQSAGQVLDWQGREGSATATALIGSRFGRPVTRQGRTGPQSPSLDPIAGRDRIRHSPLAPGTWADTRSKGLRHDFLQRRFSSRAQHHTSCQQEH